MVASSTRWGWGGKILVPLEGDRFLVCHCDSCKLFHLCKVFTWQINAIADDQSRAGQILPTEWSLHQDLADHVFSQWGYPNVDPFVTRYKCLNFVSPTPNARALNTDALAKDYKGKFVYHQILSQVLRKSDHTPNCTLLLIAPFWLKQIWFPDLLNLSHITSITLPPWEKMFKQPRSKVYHQNPRMLNLHSRKLSKHH